jgi:hypothetical protein
MSGAHWLSSRSQPGMAASLSEALAQGEHRNAPPTWRLATGTLARPLYLHG